MNAVRDGIYDPLVLDVNRAVLCVNSDRPVWSDILARPVKFKNIGVAFAGFVLLGSHLFCTVTEHVNGVVAHAIDAVKLVPLAALVGLTPWLPCVNGKIASLINV